MDDGLELDWEELGPRLRAGDEMAWKIAIDALRVQLLGIAYSIVRNRETAEDVVQSALMYSLDGIQRGKPVTDWPGYFRNMVRKEALKARSRNKHRKNVSLDTAGQGDDDDTGSWANNVPSDDQPDPLAKLLNDELHQTIKSFVEELDCDIGNVVRLRLLEEKKFQDIASELNVPVATVHYRFLRGLRQLREKLEEDGFGQQERFD